jgi:hypothetical protein
MALSAILALAYPMARTSGASPTHLVVGPVQGDAFGLASVAMEWEIPKDRNQSCGFKGELLVTTNGDEAQLQLSGTLYDDEGGEEALERVLSWLALAVESAPSSPGTRSGHR